MSKTRVHSMVFILMVVFGIVTLSMSGLFLFFYLRYTKAMETRLYMDFYSKMSHDMRTPMNGIMGMVDLAKDENDSKILHNYMNHIGESSEYLLRLINDTLDVSRISSGKMSLNLDIVNCVDIINGICDMIQISAEKKKIHFETEINNMNYRVRVDELRFKQIFINLLSNSIKFTKEGGTILFVVEGSEISSDKLHCRFIVQDTGIGMSEEFMRKSLYHPFIQEHNYMSNMSAGSGLGLTITKNLVDLMQGTIEVQSKVNQGTTFTIELDVPIVEMTENSTERVVDLSTLDGAHILLCEDHALNSEIAKRLLEKKGCLVDVAENGKLGVDQFISSEVGYYDAVLMDIRMPVMDGLSATRSIRSLKRKDAKNVAIIAMTANAYEEDRNNSREAGMNYHLSKPIDADSLYQVLADWISKEK